MNGEATIVFGAAFLSKGTFSEARRLGCASGSRTGRVCSRNRSEDRRMTLQGLYASFGKEQEQGYEREAEEVA